MTYGHSTRLSDEKAVVQRAPVRAPRTSGGFRVWSQLDAESRLALVEEALSPANDFIDAFPVAL